MGCFLHKVITKTHSPQCLLRQVTQQLLLHREKGNILQFQFMEKQTLESKTVFKVVFYVLISLKKERKNVLSFHVHQYKSVQKSLLLQIF